jgi:hypothetical protein
VLGTPTKERNYIKGLGKPLWFLVGGNDVTALFLNGCCAGSSGGSGDAAQHSLLVLSISLTGINRSEQPIYDLERQQTGQLIMQQELTILLLV